MGTLKRGVSRGERRSGRAWKWVMDGNMKGEGGVIMVSWTEMEGELKSGNYDQWLVGRSRPMSVTKCIGGFTNYYGFELKPGLDLLVRIANYVEMTSV